MAGGAAGGWTDLAGKANSRAADEILTSREAREFLKIGRTKLWELTRGNEIPAYRVGVGKKASLRYKKSELLAWLDRNRI